MATAPKKGPRGRGHPTVEETRPRAEALALELVILGVRTFEEQGGHAPNDVLDILAGLHKVSRRTLRRHAKGPRSKNPTPPPDDAAAWMPARAAVDHVVRTHGVLPKQAGFALVNAALDRVITGYPGSTLREPPAAEAAPIPEKVWKYILDDEKCWSRLSAQLVKSGGTNRGIWFKQGNILTAFPPIR